MVQTAIVPQDTASRKPALESSHKRSCEAESNGTDTTSNVFVQPILQPVFGQSMATFFQHLKSVVDGTMYERKDTMSEVGLYLHKRHIRGDHGKMLEQAGTVLQHTLIYVKTADKAVAMDYGPSGNADVTENLTESVPCGPVLHDPAEPEQDLQSLPYLHIKTAFQSLDSPAMKEAISFVESRHYNAFLNNCIQNTDFLVRVLTGGAVRNAALVFDALCGHVPLQDNPMLLMFMLMTRMSWFDVCDGGKVASAFLESHACPTLSDAGSAKDESVHQTSQQPGGLQHTDKAQKHSVGDTPETAVKENKEEDAVARQVNGHVVQPQSQPNSEG